MAIPNSNSIRKVVMPNRMGNIPDRSRSREILASIRKE